MAAGDKKTGFKLEKYQGVVHDKKAPQFILIYILPEIANKQGIARRVVFDILHAKGNNIMKRQEFWSSFQKV